MHSPSKSTHLLSPLYLLRARFFSRGRCGYALVTLFSQLTRDAEPMLIYCWARVEDLTLELLRWCSTLVEGQLRHRPWFEPQCSSLCDYTRIHLSPWWMLFRSHINIYRFWSIFFTYSLTLYDGAILFSDDY